MDKSFTTQPHNETNTPTHEETQYYYEMLSTRRIWHNGWEASTEHGPMINKGHVARTTGRELTSNTAQACPK